MPCSRCAGTCFSAVVSPLLAALAVVLLVMVAAPVLDHGMRTDARSDHAARQGPARQWPGGCAWSGTAQTACAVLEPLTGSMPSARNDRRILLSRPTHGAKTRPRTWTGCPVVTLGCSPATSTRRLPRTRKHVVPAPTHPPGGHASASRPGSRSDALCHRLDLVCRRRRSDRLKGTCTMPARAARKGNLTLDGSMTGEWPVVPGRLPEISLATTPAG